MRTKRIYVINIEHKATNTARISQEAYSQLKDAQTFIQKRSDSPHRITPFLYTSEKYKYIINDVFVHLKEEN